MAHSDNHSGNFIIGAVVGGVLGAMTAMLFTTKQGKVVQETAMDKYHDIEKMAKKLIHKRAKKRNKK